MQKCQIDAIKRRAVDLRRDLKANNNIYIDAVDKAVSDIERLLQRVDYLTAIEADNQTEIRELRRERANCMHTVQPLRDKLQKARRLFGKYVLDNPSQKDKDDLKDVLKE